MGFEIGREEFERAFDRWTGHGDQIAKTFAFVERENLAELFEDRLAALASLNFFHHQRQGVGFHAARRTLAAGFRGEKVGDAQHLFDYAGAFADKLHDAAAESGAGVAHGVMIERRVDLFRRQECR